LIINRVAGMLIGRTYKERGQCGEKMDRVAHFRGHVEAEAATAITSPELPLRVASPP
jgi:hypothetical protein